MIFETFATTFFNAFLLEHFFQEKISLYLSNMHQLTKKSVDFNSLFLPSFVAEILELQICFHFSDVRALLYKNLEKNQLLGQTSFNFGNILRIIWKFPYVKNGGFDIPGAFFLGLTQISSTVWMFFFYLIFHFIKMKKTWLGFLIHRYLAVR